MAEGRTQMFRGIAKVPFGSPAPTAGGGSDAGLREPLVRLAQNQLGICTLSHTVRVNGGSSDVQPPTYSGAAGKSGSTGSRGTSTRSKRGPAMSFRFATTRHENVLSPLPDFALTRNPCGVRS